MNAGRTVFAQLLEHLPHKEFHKCVDRYGGERYAKNFSCWEQYLAMAFAQLTYRESLRDIATCLRAVGGKLCHLGFRASVARATLADANESGDWRIFADFAQTLIATARRLYAREAMGVDLEQRLYALDSTTIDLCLGLFPWARFRRRKAAVKMHTLLDLRGNIPAFVHVTDGKVHDVNVLRHHLQHLRKVHQRNERGIESLLLRGVGERRARQIRIGIAPVIHVQNFLRIGRGCHDL